MKKRNVMTMALSLAMVGVIGVGGTLAYLSATPDKKVNTFEFANGLEATLTEDASGNTNGDATSTSSGIAYTGLVPGVNIAKNVEATFTSDIDAYFFIKIDKTTDKNTDLKITDLLLGAGWEKFDPVSGTTAAITDEDTYGEYVFEYDGTGEDVTTSADLFDTVYVDSSVTSGTLNDIIISVKAVQKDGFESMKAAYDAVDYKA